MTTESSQRSSPAFWILLVALCFLLVAGVMIFLPFWSALFLAAVFTVLLYPLYSRILRLIGEERRGLASAAICFLFLAVIVLPTAGILAQFVSQFPDGTRSVAESLVQGIDRYSQKGVVKKAFQEHPKWKQQADSIRNSLWRLTQALGPKEPSEQPGASRPEEEKAPAPVSSKPPEQQKIEGGSAGVREVPGRVAEDLGPYVKASSKDLGQFLDSMASLVTRLLTGLFGLVFNLLIMLFMMFYFFKDGPQIVASIRAGIPVDTETQERLISTFQAVSLSMIKGTFLTAVVQGFLAGMTFFILGVKAALFWGALTTVCALVPVLGTALITIPMTLTFLLSEQWSATIVMFVVALIIGAMDNFLRPLLVQGQLHLHPLWVFLSVLGGMSVFGPLGLIIGPMILVLLRTVIAVLVERSAAGAAEVAGAEPGTK